MAVEPDGRWSNPNDTGGQLTPADDDDLIEVGTSKAPGVKKEPSEGGLQQTPAHRPTLPSSPAHTPSGSKRTSDVIDLTGSDEDDEPPARPVKRHALGASGRPGYRSYSSDLLNGRYPL